LEGSSLSVLDVQNGENKVRLAKAFPAVAPAAPAPALAPAPAVAAEPVQVKAESGKTINAPIVGVFYGAPSPDSEPYVSVGKKVKKGDTVCIIEAMKCMNEIQAEEDGEIVAVLANNGDLVEYGQPLFSIK
jgi:acetyl-CoA carboxylase biotin carboxyl carrier protein